MKRPFIFILFLGFCLPLPAQKKKEPLPAVVMSASYCLPKLSFEVEVLAECIKQIPGPYLSYVERKLGIRPEITEERERWRVVDIKLIPQYIPDPNRRYTLTSLAGYPLTLSVSPEGFLVGISAQSVAGSIEPAPIQYTAAAGFSGKKIDINEFWGYTPIKEVLDSNYTMQEFDGVMKRVWDPIIRFEIKNERDNVNEAVKAIFQIRSRRASLLSPDNDIPDGKALGILLTEYERMEREFLSLFLGKEEKRTERYTFRCSPEKAGEALPLFRFSEDGGITGTREVTAPLYSLVVENVVVPASSTSTEAAGQGELYYRLPATADVKLMRLNEELRSARMVVPQLGTIASLPLEALFGEKLSVQFYPEYGTLKSISNN